MNKTRDALILSCPDDVSCQSHHEHKVPIADPRHRLVCLLLIPSRTDRDEKRNPADLRGQGKRIRPPVGEPGTAMITMKIVAKSEEVARAVLVIPDTKTIKANEDRGHVE